MCVFVIVALSLIVLPNLETRCAFFVLLISCFTTSQISLTRVTETKHYIFDFIHV